MNKQTFQAELKELQALVGQWRVLLHESSEPEGARHWQEALLEFVEQLPQLVASKAAGDDQLRQTSQQH